MGLPQVSIRCFGGVALERDGVPVAGRATQRRRLALLLILAASDGQPVSRDRLTALLWPESDAEAARHLLSGAIYELRRVLGEKAVLSRGDDVWLDTSAVRCDVAEFEAAVQAGSDEAIALYKGHFAEGFHVGAAPEFERWLDEKRGHYRRAFRRALESRAVRLREAGDPAGAAEAWLRSAAEDPADARVLMEAMRALAAAGNRTAAIKQASIYEAFVRGEIGAEPAAEVLALVDSLRRGPSPVKQAAPPPASVVSRVSGAIARVSGSVWRSRRLGPAVWIAGGAAAAAVLAVLLLGRFARSGSATPERSLPGTAVRLVVLPFSGQADSGSAHLGRTLAELLSTALDGVGDIQAIRFDTAAVGAPPGGDSVSLHAIASRLRARLYVTGTVHEASGEARVRVELRDRFTDSTIGVASAEGPAARPFGLVDTLAMALVAEMLSAPANRLSRVAARSTRSLPALKAYLAGERERRAGRFSVAAELFGRAVAADSTFALANYRLSMMTLAADLHFTEAAAADDRAFRHSERLAHRDWLLMLAYREFREGDPEAAEALYRNLTGAFPDDLEAWRQLGETFFHYNSLRGRSISEAREAFERVLADDPQDWDSLWHLALIESIAGNSAEAIRLFDRLIAAKPEPAESLELRVLRAVAARDSRAESALLPELRRADELQLHQIVWRCAIYLRDLDAADRIARLLTQPDRSLGAMRIGHLNLASLDLARGKWAAANTHFASLVPLHQQDALIYRSIVSAVAVPPRSRPELMQLRRALDTAVAPDRHTRAIRLSLRGVLSAALGDTSFLGAYASELARLAQRDTGPEFVGMAQGKSVRNAEGEEEQSTNPSPSWLHAKAELLRGMLAGARGEHQAAVTATRAGIWVTWFGSTLSHVEYSQPLERFSHAEALRAAGHHRRALELYASFAEHSPFDLPMLGPSLLRRAEMHERLGERAQAAEAYTRLVQLWKDCDPDLRPAREEARARVAALRGRVVRSKSGRDSAPQLSATSPLH